MMKRPTVKKSDTMPHAAARLGVPVAVVRFAKKRGCEAFTHSRIDIDILRQWLDSNKLLVSAEMPADKETVQVRLLLARAAMAEHELGVRRGLYVLMADAKETFRHAALTQRAVFQRKLETELPPKLAGLDALAIYEYMKRTVDEVCFEMNRIETYAEPAQQPPESIKQ